MYLVHLLLTYLCLLHTLRGHAASYNSNEIFFVRRLTTNYNITYSLAEIAGEYTSGQLAFTSEGIVVSGSDGVYLLSSDVNDTAFLVTEDPDMFFISDLRSKDLVAFVNSEGSYFSGPGYLHYLHTFSVANPSNQTIIELNQTVFIGLNSAVFAGYGYFILMDGARKALYSIDTTTGDVVSISDALDRWQQTDGWIATGVAEFFTFENMHLLYANQLGQIEQQNIANGSNQVEVVYADAPFESLSSIAVFVNPFEGIRTHTRAMNDGRFIGRPSVSCRCTHAAEIARSRRRR
ncbi:hypothetical protein EON65_23880, partial [archaeon]